VFKKMMTWWSGRDKKMTAFRVPKNVTLNTTDDDSTPLFVPTRFVSSGARERFCAALLDAQKSSRSPKTPKKTRDE
jgi:hypothetical protein